MKQIEKKVIGSQNISVTVWQKSKLEVKSDKDLDKTGPVELL